MVMPEVTTNAEATQLVTCHSRAQGLEEDPSEKPMGFVLGKLTFGVPQGIPPYLQSSWRPLICYKPFAFLSELNHWGRRWYGNLEKAEIWARREAGCAWLRHPFWTQHQWLESLLIHLLTAWSRVSSLTYLCLSFCICERGLIIPVAKRYDED